MQKKFVISIIIMFALNAVAFGAWWFIFSGIARERVIIRDLRQEAESIDRRLANIRSLGVLMENTEEETEKISAIFLNSKNIVEFIENLELINQKAGTELALKTAKLPELSDKEKPRFEFQIRGSFRDIFQYLSLFENLPYETSIEKFYLNKFESARKEEWQANFEIILLSYENS